MAEKCKKTVLTVKQKLELIEKSENRKWATKLAKDYGIGIQTCYRINGICKGL
jgi:hypothetical protein